jgi:MFS family permease
MSTGENTNTQATADTPERQVIAIKGSVHHWIEPWYLAYAILGALASGLAAILIPLVVTNSGGSSTQIGAAIAALNVGALFAPIWGWAADRSLAYRAIFLNGFLLIAAGFLGFTVMHGFGAWLISAYLVGFGTGASNTVASLFVVEFTPESEWSQRISWLQTFNALGAILGMAIAGLLQPAFGTFVAALLVILLLSLSGSDVEELWSRSRDVLDVDVNRYAGKYSALQSRGTTFFALRPSPAPQRRHLRADDRASHAWCCCLSPSVLPSVTGTGGFRPFPGHLAAA